MFVLSEVRQVVRLMPRSFKESLQDQVGLVFGHQIPFIARITGYRGNQQESGEQGGGGAWPVSGTL